MRNTEKVTVEQVEALIVKMKKLPDVKKNQPMSKQDAIKVLSGEIQKLQARGYSLEQVADFFRGEGLFIGTPTLKSYLTKAKKSGEDNEDIIEGKKKEARTKKSTEKKVKKEKQKPQEKAEVADEQQGTDKKEGKQLIHSYSVEDV